MSEIKYEKAYTKPIEVQFIKYAYYQSLEDTFVETSNGKVPAVYGFENRIIKVVPGDVIVIHPQGNKSVWTEEQFNQNYMLQKET